MRFSRISSLSGLVTSAVATNLYVSSYSGDITSVQLKQSPWGNYSLTTLATNNGSFPDPSWLTLDPWNNIIYAVDEGWGNPNGSVASYKKSPTGQLTRMDIHPCIGGPVSIVLYNEGKALAIAHYGGGGVSNFGINPNGTLYPLQAFFFTLPKPGANPERQEASHPHEVVLDPTGMFIAAPDLGADLVRLFKIDPKTSLITEVTSIPVPAGSGPRHGKFLKLKEGGTFFYLISELSNTIATYSVTYTATGLSFTALQSMGTYGNTTTPAGAGAAELILSPDNRFVLTSSRHAPILPIKNFDPTNSTMLKSDTLTVWAIDEWTGKLTFKQLAPCGGVNPRQFSLNKDGTLAAVGQQDDARIVVMKRDPVTGLFGDFVASLGVPGQVNAVIWDE